ncbi:hypothetical protein C8J56DRAFT_1066426 [Mycena floridula]|nr:hypothetical protein C8J56DRAFT_1066426 [Mycena floridula]
MVHVAKAGPLRLTFLHRIRQKHAVLSLSLLTFVLDLTSLSPGKSTPLPQLKVKASNQFQRATVEITVKAGYYEISINVTEPSMDNYELRHITAAFATGSDENAGQSNTANDGVPEKDEDRSEH